MAMARPRAVGAKPMRRSFGSDTDIERQRVIVENAQRFVRGEPLRYVIDKSLRY